MSEVKRYEINGTFDVPEIGQKLVNPKMVMESDFDRVTAERDALQALLTAADERADALEGLLRLARQFVTNGVELGYITMPDPETPDAAHDLVPMIDAALKPAEGQLNQCDGCQAGIPVVNGAHRMGKPGAYPDTMSCTAKLYKP